MSTGLAHTRAESVHAIGSMPVHMRAVFAAFVAEMTRDLRDACARRAGLVFAWQKS
ncbi:hypothetical protein [Actinomyces sp. S4-C9]|uniref:hypothetical protein n=1 Tax=Actinomyces sp. S4-C9 TaxID=1219581 RepID=UPI0012EBF7B4|nr:hypothetical protein [Actinomyces sp. S4-C9]